MNPSVPKIVITPEKSCVKPINRPLGHLVDVGNDAAQQVAVAMGINGLERYNLQFVHGAQADIARHAIGKAVGAQSQQVLGDRTDGNGRQKLG